MEARGSAEDHYHELGQEGQKKRGSRLPNWEKHETLVLVHAKKTYDDDTKDGKEKGHVINHDMKWTKISAICGEGGVKRDPEKCRRRWQTIYADYKRIRDHESKSGQESYWLLSARDRKDSGVPAVFDKDIYEVMDAFLRDTGKVRVLFDSAMFGNSLEGDTDEPSYSLDAPSAKVPPALPKQAEADAQGEEHAFQQSSGTAREDPPPLSSHRRKRRRSLQGDASSGLFVDAFESTARLIIETQERTSELDRASRERMAKLDRDQRERQCATMSFAIHFLADAIRGVADSIRGVSKDN